MAIGSLVLGRPLLALFLGTQFCGYRILTPKKGNQKKGYGISLQVECRILMLTRSLGPLLQDVVTVPHVQWDGKSLRSFCTDPEGPLRVPLWNLVPKTLPYMHGCGVLEVRGIGSWVQVQALLRSQLYAG